MTCLPVREAGAESAGLWWSSVLLSLGVHAIVLAGFVLAAGISSAFTLDFSFGGKGSPEMDYAGMVLTERGGPGADPVKNIIGSLPARLQEAQKLSPGERALAIRAGAEELSAVGEESFAEISELFPKEGRAYAPVIPRPAGEFDVESQIPYDLTLTEDGGCIMVLLDSAGRTSTMMFLKAEMTEDVRAAADIFKMMRQMPGLRKVYMRMAVQLLPVFTEGGKDGTAGDK